MDKHGLDYFLRVTHHTEKRTLEERGKDLEYCFAAWRGLADWSGDILLNWPKRKTTAAVELTGLAAYMLKTSGFLVASGFYRAASTLLYQALHLLLYAVYYEERPHEHELFMARPNSAPSFTDTVCRVCQIEMISKFNEKSNLMTELLQVHDELLLETCSYGVSGQATHMTEPERVSFTYGVGSASWHQPEPFDRWIKAVKQLYELAMTLLILTHPATILDPGSLNLRDREAAHRFKESMDPEKLDRLKKFLHTHRNSVSSDKS